MTLITELETSKNLCYQREKNQLNKKPNLNTEFTQFSKGLIFSGIKSSPINSDLPPQVLHQLSLMLM